MVSRVGTTVAQSEGLQLGVRMGEWGGGLHGGVQTIIMCENITFLIVKSVSAGNSCLVVKIHPSPPLCFVPPLCDVTKSSERPPGFVITPPATCNCLTPAKSPLRHAQAPAKVLYC